MTISSSTRKAGPFTGDGVTVAFPFAFKVFTKSDILIVDTVTATGLETNLVLDSDYSVTLNPDQTLSPGGTVTASVAPVAGHTLTIVGSLPALQETDLTNGGAFYAEVVENSLDYLTILAQQLKEAVDRAVKVGVASGVSPDVLLDSLNTAVDTAVNSAATASTAATSASGSAAAAAASAAAIALPLAVSSGGTGATSAANARTNLGALAKAGDTLTGALNEAKGANIASAATVNLDTATGNLVHITGTTSITAITLAGGAQRTVIFDASLTLTNGASLLLPGAANVQTAAGDVATFRGDGSGVVKCTGYSRAAVAPGSAAVPANISGLVPSNNGGAPTTTVDISAGFCTDASGAFVLSIAATFSKRINAAFAAGSGNGGLDTGAVAASTEYWLWAIRKDSDGSTDFLFSLSATAPTMPGGYTAKRLIGWVLTDGSSNIVAFHAYESAGGGVYYQWDAVASDSTTALATTAASVALRVPSGVKLLATLSMQISNTTLTNMYGLVSSLDQTDVAVTASTANVGVAGGSASVVAIGEVRVMTDTAKSIRVRGSAAASTTVIRTKAFEWSRR